MTLPSTYQSTAPSVNKVGWIASLRGLLVLFVFFSHLQELHLPWQLMFVVGRVGVVGFFLLAGYLAFASLQKRTLAQFGLNRFLRIYPVFWLLLSIYFILDYQNTSWHDFLLNLTLFNELFGSECLITPSWMLPIMVVLYVVLMGSKKRGKKWVQIAYVSAGVVALLMGWLRMKSGQRFPTAFCLLVMVGLLGYIHKWGKVSRVRFVFLLIMFEVVLLTASITSYGREMLVYYLLGYNLGLILFLLFAITRFQSPVLPQIGDWGFTLFLGAELPVMALEKCMDVGNLPAGVYVSIKFVLACALAWLVTTFVERPLLTKGKIWEHKIIKF